MLNKFGLMAIMLVGASLLSPAQPASAAANSLGTNIISGGTVYTILREDGRTVKRPYTSAGAFLSYTFNSWSNVFQANNDDLALPVGSFIPPRDGTIMCSDRGSDYGTCYLVTDSKKAGFVSEQVFYQFGFTYQWALYGDVSFLASTTNIESGTEQHRPGMILSWNGKTHLITNAGLKEIPDTATLLSWGYRIEDAIAANSADWQFAIDGQLPSRAAGEIRPDLGEAGDSDAEPLKIETSSLPDATAGLSYSKRLRASGGVEPYRWSTVSTTYPSGCCVLGISGLPGGQSDYYGTYDPVYFNTQSGDYVLYEHLGTYSWTIKVTDANGNTATKTLQLTIQQ